MSKPIVSDFGAEPIGKLLVRQAVPASIGILVGYSILAAWPVGR